MGPKKQLWLPEHVKLLETQPQASHDDISRILKHTFNAAFDPEAVAATREEIGMATTVSDVEVPVIPAKTPPVIKIATSKKIVPIDDEGGKPLSSSKVSQKTKKPKVEKAPVPETLSETFLDVAVREVVAAPQPSTKTLHFIPAAATSYKKGQYYYHPVQGVAQYKGITKTSVAGYGELETMTFVASAGMTLNVPKGKIADQNFRVLAGETFMDEVLRAIGNGSDRGKRPQGAGDRQIKTCKAILDSGDPVSLAGLIYWSFKAPEKLNEKSRINASYGDAAIKKLSEEYAVVKRISFDKAKLLFQQNAGRPTRKDLVKNTESPTHWRRNKGEPSPS